MTRRRSRLPAAAATTVLFAVVALSFPPEGHRTCSARKCRTYLPRLLRRGMDAKTRDCEGKTSFRRNINIPPPDNKQAKIANKKGFVGYNTARGAPLLCPAIEQA